MGIFLPKALKDKVNDMFPAAIQNAREIDKNLNKLDEEKALERDPFEDSRDGSNHMNNDILLVIVPGLNGKRDDWDYLIDQIESNVPSPNNKNNEESFNSVRTQKQPHRIDLPEHIRESLSDLTHCRLHRLYFAYPQRLFSTSKTRDLAIRLNALIHQRWIVEGGFSKIIIVGHSMGGMIVRQAFLFGLGTEQEVSVLLPWAEKVSRVVLFASINRGIDHNSRWFIWLFSRLILWLKPLEKLMLADVLRGSDFLCNLQIEWIRYFSGKYESVKTSNLPDKLKLTEVVQVLGDKDCYVSSKDSFDVEISETGYSMTVPYAEHGNLHKVSEASDPKERLTLLTAAMFGKLTEFAQNRNIRTFHQVPDRVIFLLHGIRAANYQWPRLLEQNIKAISNKPDDLILKPSYGYFSALRFAFPYTRRKNLAWFKDTYTQNFAANPKADFSFIGHSNGTYLLGHSLTAVQGIEFSRVALIGSVLPSEFDWMTILNRGQVKLIRNERARDDVPVGYLCSGLRGLGMKDVGTGGMLGFYQDHPNKAELFWYQGGHGAVFGDANAVESLAAYVLGQKAHYEYVSPPSNCSNINEPSPVFSFMMRSAWVHFSALVIILAIWIYYVLALMFNWYIPGVEDVYSWINPGSNTFKITFNILGVAGLIFTLDTI